ncbi:hypothetical protein [Vogesella indigofera]|uniref:hypothetical protein n=1 Tax=Vogesella indigofera TaxID=45465 RepID=UPI00234F8B7F|nr:hypothetical protein [Vogesella indigofera]MDC7696419.1 hypothetical protein [Vogesella indigofera]
MTTLVDTHPNNRHKRHKARARNVASPRWLPIGFALMLSITGQVLQAANAADSGTSKCVQGGKKMFVQTIRVVWKGLDIPSSNVPFRLKAPDGKIITEGRTDSDGMIRLVLKRRLVPKGSIIELPGGSLTTTTPAVSEC